MVTGSADAHTAGICIASSHRPMKVEPASPRFSLSPMPDGISASIPARKNWFYCLFLPLWLCGWGLGEFTAIHEIASGKGMPFVLVWLAGWSVGGCWAVCMLLWQLAGREVITVTAGELVYRVAFCGIGRTRRFSLPEIRRLRAVDYSNGVFSHQNKWSPPLFGSGVGPIAFDYGARTYRMAPSLDEAEGYHLVLALREFLPRE